MIKRELDAGSDHDSALLKTRLMVCTEVSGSSLAGCHFLIPSPFFTMFSSLTCLSFSQEGVLRRLAS